MFGLLGMKLRFCGVNPFNPFSVSAYPNCKLVDVDFDNKMKAIVGDTLYFQGNSFKNTLINNKITNKDTTNLLILCKELGDTLQAYYGRKFIEDGLATQKNICLFTNDRMLMYRCQLLHVPVVFSTKRDKTTKVFYFHPVIDEMQAEFINMYREQLASHNESVVTHINRILAQQFFLTMNGRTIRFDNSSSSSEIATVLRKLIEEINYYTQYCLNANIRWTNINHYRRLIEVFYAVHMFYGNVLITIPDLFIRHSDSFVLPTSYHRFLAAVAATQVGGSDGSAPRLFFDTLGLRTPSFDFMAEIDPQMEDYTETRIFYSHELFTQLIRRFMDKTIVEICVTTSNIGNLLYHYFGYAARSSWNSDFLAKIVDLYYSEKGLDLSLVEFEKMIKAIRVDDAEDDIPMPDMDISYLLESLVLYPVKRSAKTLKNRRPSPQPI